MQVEVKVEAKNNEKKQGDLETFLRFLNLNLRFSFYLNLFLLNLGGVTWRRIWLN